MSHPFDHIIKALVFSDGRLETDRLTVAAAATASAVILCGSGYALERFPRPTIQSLIAIDSYWPSRPDAAVAAGIFLATNGKTGDAVRLPGLLNKFFLAPDAAGCFNLVKIISKSEGGNGDITILGVTHRFTVTYLGRTNAVELFFRDINPTIARPLISLAMAQEDSNQVLRQTSWQKGDETSFLRAARAVLRRAAATDPDFRIINELSIMASVDLTAPVMLTLDVNFRDLLRASGRSLNDTFACSALVERWNKTIRPYHALLLDAGLPGATAMVPIDRSSKIYPPSDREYADGWQRQDVPAILTIDLKTSAHEELADEVFLAELEASESSS